MITLDADNRYVHIRGADRSTIRKIEKVTSYLVAGFMFAPSFRRRVWDGREHLMAFSEKEGYRVPFGLLGDVMRCLDEEGERYKLDQSRRSQVPKVVTHAWNKSIVLRPYQTDAVDTICEPDRWDTGRGLLKMPIRSGKTKTAARIIYKLRTTALFIVPSQMLLHQTVAALEEALMRRVGVIGDGAFTVEDVTVATVQSISRLAPYKPKRGENKKARAADPRYKPLLKRFGLILMDEAHHGKAPTWRSTLMNSDARYKIGLSATLYLDLKKEAEKGVIWVKGCCGDIRVDISASELIEQGYLMRPIVNLHRVEEPKELKDWKWSAELRDKAIYDNPARNALIARLARQQLKAGLKVLIVTNRHNQIARLADLFERARVPFETITGPDDNETRQHRVKQFVSGRVSVLIGTVFGEGVDIPEIECVINAEGGEDMKATMQRMRNLTITEDKTQAIFIDFIDLINPYFAGHSRSRIQAYRSEGAFQLRLVE